MKILYILVRTDMDSMRNCPGKGMAQASHATSKFHNAMDNPSGSASWSPEYVEWRNQADSFGTCITLGVTESEMREVIKFAELNDVPCGIVNDPTYPLRDGDVTHYIPLDTCAWVFGDKDELSYFVGHLELHR